jgi:large subunit ribosomal protein L35
MPKMKTNKAIAKRVKITARGKVLRRKAGSSHLRSVKSPSRLRRFRKQPSPKRQNDNAVSR